MPALVLAWELEHRDMDETERPTQLEHSRRLLERYEAGTLFPAEAPGKGYLEMTPEERAADREASMGPAPGREGFWAHHNCHGCRDGFRPCRDGRREHCGRPRARND